MGRKSKVPPNGLCQCSVANDFRRFLDRQGRWIRHTLLPHEKRTGRPRSKLRIFTRIVASLLAPVYCAKTCCAEVPYMAKDSLCPATLGCRRSPLHVHPTVVFPQPEQYLTASLTKPTPPHLPQIAGSVSWRLSILGNTISKSWNA